MTVIFTTSELGSLQETQEAYMQDTCNLITISGYIDSFGDYLKTWITTSGISCGLEEINSIEKYSQITISDLDAVIRISLGVVVSEKDRVEITQRYGIPTSKTFEVIGIKQGPSCKRLLLKGLTYV